MFLRFAVILAGSCLIAGLPASAQMRDNSEKQLDCRGNRGGRDARFCEIREQTMAVSPALNIDAGVNGGIQVKGWTRGEVLVRARVDAWARDDAQARSIASQVRVITQPGRIYSEGPSNLNREGWSVSFEVFTPHRTGITAKAHNGGLMLSDLSGVIEGSTLNGGLHISRLAGTVKGTTTNGGVHVELAGTRWDGDSLDLRTTNGGVHVQMPSGYNARLEASTTNGGLHVGFPVTVTGEIGKRISTTIGGGGPLLRFNTVNGGVHIDGARSGSTARRRSSV